METHTVTPFAGPLTPETMLLVPTGLMHQITQYLLTKPAQETYQIIKAIEGIQAAPIIGEAPIPPWHPADLDDWAERRRPHARPVSAIPPKPPRNDNAATAE